MIGEVDRCETVNRCETMDRRETADLLGVERMLRRIIFDRERACAALK
jgi:hypothetical protein